MSKKYRQYAPVPSGLLIGTDVSLISRDGAPDVTYSHTMEQLAAYIGGVNTPANVKYVASNGDNASPTAGAFGTPYATVFQAMDDISDTSVANIIVVLDSITADAVPIPVKPNTAIVGFSKWIYASLSLELDQAAYTANPGGLFMIENIQIDAIDFDTTFLTNKDPYFRLNSVEMNTFELNGGLNSIYCQVYNSQFYNNFIVDGNVRVDSRSNMYNNCNIGKTTANTKNATARFDSLGDKLNNQLNLKVPSTPGELQLHCRVIGAYKNLLVNITLEGDVFLHIDSTSVSSGNITIVGGTPDVTYIDSGKSIGTSYAPVNYDYTTDTVDGQFAGIDNKMAAAPMVYRYVDSEGGSDTAGADGSILNPWASLTYMYSRITDASSSKYYFISATGIFDETDLVIKPYIFVNMNGSKLTTTNPVELSAAFTSSGGVFGFSNCAQVISEDGWDLDFGATACKALLSDLNFTTHTCDLTLQGNALSSILLRSVGGASDDLSYAINLGLSGFAYGSLRNVSCNEAAISQGPSGDTRIVSTGFVCQNDLTLTSDGTQEVNMDIHNGYVGNQIILDSTGVSAPGTVSVTGSGGTIGTVSCIGTRASYTGTFIGGLTLGGGATYYNSIHIQKLYMLQFQNTTQARKIVTYDNVTNNDHQFAGISADATTAIYRIADAAHKHAFIAGTSSSTSASLAEIHGDGTMLIGAGTKDANSALDVISTTKGFSPPEMTTVQKDAIPTSARCQVVWDTNLQKLCVRPPSSGTWQTVTSV